VARHAPSRETTAARSEPVAVAPVFAVESEAGPPMPPTRELSPEEELEAWKAERMRTRLSRVPWRQIYIMAGLCFGIGGFMLPDSVNDVFSWVLYGLMAASFYAGLVKRREAALAH
jgi:hypothetical protein